MRRDYAKKKPKSRSSRQSYLRLWLSTITLFVLFTLGLVFLGKHYQLETTANKFSSKNLVKKLPPKQILPEKSPKQLKQPHFDFYTTK